MAHIANLNTSKFALAVILAAAALFAALTSASAEKVVTHHLNDGWMQIQIVEDGKIQSHANFRDGLIFSHSFSFADGTEYRRYYRNGSLRIEQFHRADGSLKRENIWRDGQIVRVEKYDLSGELYLMTHYGADGSIIEDVFLDGRHIERYDCPPDMACSLTTYAYAQSQA